MPMNRRTAIKLAAAAAVGPMLWSRQTRAATEAFGAVKHVLLLNCRGGFRSHATFNAVGAFQHNPFGAQDAAAGTQWRLGAACGRQTLTTSLGRVAPLAEVSADIAVLGAVDPNKGGVVEVDHVAGQRRVGTGLPDGRNGVLSLLGAHHPLYAQGISAAVLPPVEIGPSDLGLGEGVYGATRPLTLFAGQGGFSSTAGIQASWHSSLRQSLDARFLAKRSRAYTKRLQAFQLAKQNASLFLSVLQDPRFDILGAPDATDAGVSNSQLIEVLGDHDMTEIGDPQGGRSWGADIALALRCLSFGAPIVAVTHDGFDMHDIERDAYAPRTSDLARQLAGLHFLLKRMPHPEGGTYFDHTLVLTTSEFSRNNTFAETGFNSGNGSDHVADGAAAPARNMAIAVMGGVVATKGRLIGETDSELRAQGAVFSTADLLATIFDVLGVDPSAHLPGSPVKELFV